MQAIDLHVHSTYSDGTMSPAELLKLAVPDFNDWDNLPESESRALLLKVIELQDFKGFIINFFSLGTAIIR